MGDTGERRQISSRANANQIETIRASRKLIIKARSKTVASKALLSVAAKDSQRAAKGSNCGVRKPDLIVQDHAHQ